MACRQRRPPLIVWRRPGGPACGARVGTPVLTVAPDREFGGGQRAGRARRGRGRARGCGVTHVRAPPWLLFRRLDETSVIGEVLAARAGGMGYRAIAGLLGRAAAGAVGLAAELGMVRRCVTRFTVNAGRLRAAFTALVHQVDASPPVMTSGRGAVAEAVAAIGEAAAAVRRLLGTAMAAVSPWEVAAAVSHGRLLAVSPPARLFSTSGHLEPAM